MSLFAGCENARKHGIPVAYQWTNKEIFSSLRLLVSNILDLNSTLSFAI
jgi:hypothetical protein